MNDIVHVAVAVIRNSSGQVFISCRPDHVHQGGLWEFPGGKVETGESVQDALRREIHEENGIDIQQAQPLIKIPFKYPDKHVLLDVWEVLSYEGVAHGREGQACRWVWPHELSGYDFPAANQAILTAAQLPKFYLITPEPDENVILFLQQLERKVRAGIKLVQLRAKNLKPSSYIDLAQAVIGLCHQYHAKVMLNTSLDIFDKVQAQTGLYADGLHLSSQRLLQLAQRPVSLSQYFAASCHNVNEITHANRLGADFVVAGSVKATTSHPQGSILGWHGFTELTEQAVMPVFALGGMTVEDADHSRQCGGQGIAAIRSLWDD